MKLISIVLPVYNGEKYLAMSIESCLNQTYQNIELIIVNDCSTDGTLDIINRYSALDDRIRIIINKENKKLPASLNIGHKEAKGDYITWTSDDNFYELNALEILLEEILEKEADIAYSNFVLIDDTGEKIREVEFIGIENIIFGNFIGCCFLYRKEVFHRNRGYNENYFLVEDYDFWLRAVVHSRFCQTKKILYNYRKHDESLTNQIATDSTKKDIWKANINKMYNNFCFEILKDKNNGIATLLFKSLIYEKIDFEWLRKKDNEIHHFKKILKQNANFSNGEFIEKVFLKHTIEIMTKEQNFKNNFLRSVFIVKKYGKFMNKNDFKTLIKYSFFKL